MIATLNSDLLATTIQVGMTRNMILVCSLHQHDEEDDSLQ